MAARFRTVLDYCIGGKHTMDPGAAAVPQRAGVQGHFITSRIPENVAQLQSRSGRLSRARLRVLQGSDGGTTPVKLVVTHEGDDQEYTAFTIAQGSGATTLESLSSFVVKFAAGDALAWSFEIPSSGSDIVLSYLSLQVELA